MLALHDNERLLAAYRKTWVVFAATGIVAFIAFTLPLIVFPFSRLVPAYGGISLLPQLSFFFVMLWWWGVWIGAFFSFTNQYLDVFVVTNERIIHIEQLSIFKRTISELRLERVQDVTVEQHGLLATILHYGTIRVQTAGETGEFTFRAIPRPLRAKEVIMAAHREAVLRERRRIGSSDGHG